MKKKILVLSLFFMSGVAKADYKCFNEELQASLTVGKNYFIYPGDEAVHLESATSSKHWTGFLHEENSTFFNKKTIKLYPSQGGSLTIVTKPGSCGRGSCDFGSSVVITAKLVLDNTTTYFSCDEINP